MPPVFDITLINPPANFLLNPLTFPSLGLLYVSAYLKSKGIKVRVIDLNIDKQPKLSGSDIYGITATTPQYSAAKDILNLIKMINPESYVMIGGPHASCYPFQSQYDGFDLTVVGDGEEATYNVIKNRRGKNIIIYPDEIKNLDELPFPDRDAIDIKKYHYEIDGVEATNMITSRGCPYSCAFCCRFLKGVRFRSAKNVLAEVEELKNKYGYGGIMFYDDIFILKKDRLKEICAGLKKLNMIWRCFIRANIITEDIIKMMAESGCVEVGMGVESGSQQILNNINKKTSVEQNTEAVRMCHKYGIRLKAFLIVGLPGESKETIEKTKKWIETAQPDDIDVSLLQVYKASDIFKNPNKYDIKFSNPTFFKGIPGHYIPTISTSHLTSKELLNARNEIEAEFKHW